MGRVNKALIEMVEKEEREAKQRADAARAEIIGREIRMRIEGGKPMTETGEKTGEKTVEETGPRRRRRFTLEAPDATPPPAAETSDTGDSWAEKDRGGYFSGRPGPGRGHTADGVAGRSSGAWGEGDGDLDLLKEMVAAIERRGPRWFDELLKASPVTSAQLLAALRKTTPAPGQPGGGEININFGDGPLAGIAASIMAPAAGDADGLDLDAARQEVRRLRAELDATRRAANDTAPPKAEPDAKIIAERPPGPPLECPQCRRVGYPNRLIQPGTKCRFGCGQHYDDAAAGRETPGPPDLDDRPRSADAFVVTAGPELGWAPVDTSRGIVAGVREALSGGRRGI